MSDNWSVQNLENSLTTWNEKLNEGVIKTCGSFTEIKRPEQVFKLFVRFVIAQSIVTYGLELMMAVFKIVQGIISTIMSNSGLGNLEMVSTLREPTQNIATLTTPHRVQKINIYIQKISAKFKIKKMF